MVCTFVTSHAVRRAEERLSIFNRQELLRLANEAIEKGLSCVVKQNKFLYNGIVFAFTKKNMVLTSVWRVDI